MQIQITTSPLHYHNSPPLSLQLSKQGISDQLQFLLCSKSLPWLPISRKSKNQTHCIDLCGSIPSGLVDFLFPLYSQDMSLLISRENRSTLPLPWMHHLLCTILPARATWCVPSHLSHFYSKAAFVVTLSKTATPEHSIPSPPPHPLTPSPLLFLFFLSPFNAPLILLVCPDYFLFLHVEFVGSTKARTSCLFCSLYRSRSPIKIVECWINKNIFSNNWLARKGTQKNSEKHMHIYWQENKIRIESSNRIWNV